VAVDSLRLPMFGLLVGLIIRMGGAVIMTYWLMLGLGLGLPPTAAIGSYLAYSTMMKLVGALQHGR